MINRESIVDIDIAKNSGIHRTHLNYSIGDKDDDFDIFGVRVFRNGQPVDLTGSSVQGHFRPPQGDDILVGTGSESNTGYVSGNVAFVTLSASCYNYPGQFSLSIKLFGGGVKGTVRIVDGMVAETYTTENVAPVGAIPTYEEILAVYEQMEELVDTAGGVDEMPAVGVNLPNMLTGNEWVLNKGLNADGTEDTSTPDMKYSDLVEIVHPNDYTLTFTPEGTKQIVRVIGYNEDESFKRQFTAISTSNQTVHEEKKYTFAAADCKYFRISIPQSYKGVYVCQTTDDKLLQENMEQEAERGVFAHKNNMLEGVGYTEYGWIGANGAPVMWNETSDSHVPYYRYTDLIKVQPGKRYFLAAICKKNRTISTGNDIWIDGYDESGTWVKRLRTIPAEDQTHGVVSIEPFYTENCTQIRVSLLNFYIYAMAAYDDLDETIMQSCFEEHTIPASGWAVGSLRYNNGTVNTSKTDRIHSVRVRNNETVAGYANLAAEFIRAENAKVCLFVWNRYVNNESNDNEGFCGVWDGTKLQKSKVVWFDFINLRAIYNQYKSQYPNFIYKLSVMIPGNNSPTAADGTKVKFYTKPTAYGTVGTYETWAVIGASSDAGGNNEVDHFGYAWPNVLARMMGNTVSNYSKWGRSLASFIRANGAQETGLYRVLHDPAKELYVITLGGNDASGTMDIGDISNVNDTPAAEGEACSTVYGCYGYIMNQLTTTFADAKFVLTTPPGANYSKRQLQLDNCVREMAAHFNVPYIEWESDEYMRSDEFVDHFGSDNHPTKIQYGGKALAFERLFSRCVGENVDYFA